jgi:hypothetical protein
LHEEAVDEVGLWDYFVNPRENIALVTAEFRYAAINATLCILCPCRQHGVNRKKETGRRKLGSLSDITGVVKSRTKMWPVLEAFTGREKCKTTPCS